MWVSVWTWCNIKYITFHIDEYPERSYYSFKMTNTNYEAASAAMTAAQAVYNEAARAYRAREIGDDEYFAARAVWKAAQAAYDAAYAAASV